MRYAVIIEQRTEGFRAIVPDLPGCIATGRTAEEAGRSIRIAIRYHVDAMRDDGAAIPAPTSQVQYVAIGGRPG